MTEKRYYAHKHILQENKVHDKICPKFMNIDETVEHMNNQYWKYKQLKDENLALKEELKGMEELLQSYRRTIKHDAKLLADATKNGYLPPLEDWKKGSD